MAVIKASEFNYSLLADIPIIEKQKRKKNSRSYLDIICAFDIEASRLPDIEQSVMYIWQFQFGKDLTIIGRTWEEFLTMMEHIAEHIRDIAYMVIYVHNLSYEFSFLKGIYRFQPEEVFCTDARKVLKCEMMDCIEFRCSYYLSNMSLDAFLKKYNVPNKKLTYDYAKIRYPWTELTDDEMNYCINDVIGLVQALEIQMKSDGDDLQSIPLTSTGYVRRDVKEAMRRYNHEQLHDMLPDTDVYQLLREAFRGGDTLSNRWMTDEIIENVQSVDIVSSYPASMLMCRYPMTRFYRHDPEDFQRIYNSHYYAMLFRVVFVGIETEAHEGHLYLSRDKCREIYEGTFVNGRILQAQYLETTITDIDFEIICRRYHWKDMIVKELWCSKYRMLPSMLRNVIRQYYTVKTELKGCDENSDDYLYYMKNKEKLNSTYGMTVEDPAKDTIEYRDGEFIEKDEDLAHLILKHNHSAFLSYAWGVWVTAHSRKRLADGIDIVTKGGDEPMNFIYSDTDSIKYVGDPDFTKYNENVEQKAIQCGAMASDRNGEMHFMGVYESEGYRLPNRFKTMGAKKYVLEDDHKKLHITIAGVDKKLGGAELGKLENFQEGFIFRKAGGTESVFNDNIDMTIFREGRRLRITDNVVIRDSSYTLGLTQEYRAILNGLISIKYSDEDIDGLYKVKR